jgi:PAS domain S-box-containing protein
MISSGALFWGFAGFVASLFGTSDDNLVVTIHSICAFASSLLYAAGALVLLRKNKSLAYPGLWMTVFYSITAVFISLIVILVLEKRVPDFFVEGEGSTGIRYFVLSFSVLLFTSTALLLRNPVKSSQSQFVYWFAIALWLIATGLFGSMLETEDGTLVSWIGRASQYLSGVYLLIAAFKSVRETNVWGLALEEGFHRTLKKSQDELIESEVRYRQIVELSGEGILITDADRKISFTNSRMCELMGMTSEELIGRKTKDLLDPGYMSLVDKTREKLSKGENIHQEFKFLRKDGSPLWVISNATPVLDHEGKETRTISMLTDITERKIREEVLRISEQRLKFHLENSPLAVVEWDADYIVIQWSIEAERIFGWKKDAAIGKRIDSLNLIYKEDLQIVARVMERLSSGKERIVVSTNRNVRQSGEIIECTWYNSVLLDENNKMSSVMSLVQDITEIKRTERDREQLLGELNEAQEKLNIALENGNIGIWDWDLKTNRVTWDERMERMFNLHPGSFGQTYKDFEALVNEEDLNHMTRAVNDAIEKDLPLETLLRTRANKGNARYISSKALLNRNKDGWPESFSGVSFDVTGLKEDTEKLILKLNEELLRSNKELESFAYVASHDLQEPLRMVSSFTQLLSQQYGDKLDAKAQEYIRLAVDGSKRMYDLINGLLSYSRIQSKAKVFTNVDLEKVLEIVLKNLSLKINESKTVVEKTSMPSIHGDESQMIQLFQNLIVNGIKFNKGIPTIIVSAEDTGTHIKFSVKDNGIGIESQYYDRIFQIFQRLQPKDDYEGTGLGLSICKRIVERHGGKMWVVSEPGKGSEFLFTIPKPLNI